MTVISGADIIEQRIEGVEDFLTLTPNVTFVSNQGTRTSYEIAVRGVSNVGGAANVFGVYVDEFNIAPSNILMTLNQALLDIDQIEVLRGPQGTFFGRNVTAGAINISTTKPGKEFSGNATLEAGSFDTYLGRASVNVPIVQDSLFVRVSGLVESSGGFLKNEGPSDATNSRDTYSGRLAVRALPTDRLTVDASVTYTDYEQGFNDAVATGQPNDTFEFLGFEMVPPNAGFFPENTDTIATDRPQITTNDTLIVTSRVEYAGDGIDAIGVLGYIDADANVVGEFDFVPADNYFALRNATFLESWSAEFRLQSDSDSSWEWLIGGLYANDKSSFEFEERFGSDWQQFLRDFTGNQGLVVPPGVGFLDFGSIDATSYGIFGDMTWRGLEDRLSMSASVRWAHDEIEQTDRSISLSPTPPFGPGDSGLLEGGSSFEAFLPRFSVTYEVAEDLVTLYAVAAKGYKPGGFNLGSVNVNVPNAPNTYDQETLWNYELGVKGSLFDSKLRLNLAAFYTDWSDLQVPALFFDPDTLLRVPLVQNYPSATSKGIELEFSAEPMEGLLLQGGIGFNDATFGDGPDIIVAQAVSVLGNVTGNQLPLASRWTGNTAVQYRRPFSSQLDGFVRLEYIYQGRRFEDVDNRRISGDLIPKYDTINVRAGVEWENLSIIVFGENVINEDYVTGYRSSTSLNGALAVVNPKRFGVRAIYNF